MNRILMTAALSVLTPAAGPAVASAAPAAEGSRTPRDSALWESYMANPNSHPNIPNNSFAGYAYGERPVPELAAVVNAQDYGAVGDGKTDSTWAINEAIAQAARKGGGAVLLPAGTYRISGVLWMHFDGVVLRGEGAAKTVLFCSRPLRDAIGPNPWGEKSGWSWSGGFVWFVPREVRSRDWKAKTQTEGWPNSPALADITSPARRGDTVLTLRAAGLLTAGAKVLLSLRDGGDFSLWKNMAADVPGVKDYDWNRKARTLVSEPEWRWPVQIKAIHGNQVTLYQPLRTDIRKEWQPRFLGLGPVVQGSGVERLTLQMEKARLSPHLENPGWNGVYFENAWDCWARDVVIRDADNGIGTTSSKCITADGFTILGRKAHHATFCRVGSHDILWTRFHIVSKVHHGINVEGLSSGNVWSAADMDHGTFDSHRGLPFENIRTDISVVNDGRPGGADDAGPLFGARFSHWNIRIQNGTPDMILVPQLMPQGSLVGVLGATTASTSAPDFPGASGSVVAATTTPAVPPDLHLAQLALRLGRDPFWLGRGRECPHPGIGRDLEPS